MKTQYTTTATLLFTLFTLSNATGARNYALSDAYVGYNFLDGWDHQNITDPTNGRVNYVDQTTALAQNLTFVSADTLVLKADSTTVLSPTGPGRNSVRLITKKQYTTSVTVLNLRHMPQGCATWPAFWTTSSTVAWPTAGEIDIIEGINDQIPNASTLHTTPGCTMTDSTMKDTGKLIGTNCDSQANSNQGCQVQVDKANNYGPQLNANGGGWYAMERTPNFINMWFWPRNDASVPAEVKNGAPAVNPAHWGKPFANFVNTNCDINSKFGPNNLIINLTFCGDWAGNNYPATCPQSCVNNVNVNPGNFVNAYWDIASINVYTPGCTTGTSVVAKRGLTDGHHHHNYQSSSWKL